MTMTERERGGRRPGRKRRHPLRWLIPGLAVVVTGALWFNWQCWGLQTTHTEVVLSGLPAGFDGLRIVHLSDLHGHEYGQGSAELLERVAKEKPEIIVLTGDIIDREEQMDMIPALARGLAAIAPTFYVTGNHEWGVGTDAVRKLKPLLSECGVTVLTNRYEILERNGDQIVLAGVDDPNGFADQKTPEELAAQIADRAPGLYTILLAHRNDRFDQYAAAGYDLILSGHAHGGIVRLPFTDGLISTGLKLFPRWTSGVYTLGDSTLFVSRGLGNNTVPAPGFRLFNRPEAAVITLRAA